MNQYLNKPPSYLTTTLLNHCPTRYLDDPDCIPTFKSLNKLTDPWYFWWLSRSKIFILTFNIVNCCFNGHFLIFNIIKAFELMFSWLLKNNIIDCIWREDFFMNQFNVWIKRILIFWFKIFFLFWIISKCIFRNTVWFSTLCGLQLTVFLKTVIASYIGF